MMDAGELKIRFTSVSLAELRGITMEGIDKAPSGAPAHWTVTTRAPGICFASG